MSKERLRPTGSRQPQNQDQLMSARSKSPTSLTYSEKPLTLQDVMKMGEEAARALEAPVFTIAVRTAMEEIKREWLESAPEEKNKREDLYRQVRSLDRVCAQLVSMRSALQQIESEKLEEEQRYRAAYEAGILPEDV